MAGIDDSVQPSLTPDDDTALKDILGYLNFSSGAGDARFQKNLDRLHLWFAVDGGAPRISRLLAERLETPGGIQRLRRELAAAYPAEYRSPA